MFKKLKEVFTKKDRDIYFAKLRSSAIVPSKREEDGAFDIYANFDEDYIMIKPHETRLIPTGLCSAFSKDFVAILKERGSTGSKGMGIRAGVIDSGYRGEWFVATTNHNNKPVIIVKKDYFNETVNAESDPNVIVYPYEKAICQCVLVQVPKTRIRQTSVEHIESVGSERGKGALGSSNK